MADATNLYQKIEALRALVSKDSITPDSLGVILKEMVDILNDSSVADLVEKYKAAGAVMTGITAEPTANRIDAKKVLMNLSTGDKSLPVANEFIPGATTEKAGAMTAEQVNTLNALKNLIDLFSLVGSSIVDFSTMPSANNVKLWTNNLNLKTGATFDKVIDFLKAADETQAGLLTAEQFKNLENFKNFYENAYKASPLRSFSVSQLSEAVQFLGKKINFTTGDLETEVYQTHISGATKSKAGIMTAKHVQDLEKAVANAGTAKAADLRFSLWSDGRKLYIRGHEKLLAQGLVPYVFRHTGKQNQSRDASLTNIVSFDNFGHTVKRRGWNLWKSKDAVAIDPEENFLRFFKGRKMQSIDDAERGSAPSNLVYYCRRLSDGSEKPAVRWGSASVNLVGREGGPRLLRFRHAIAFGRPIAHGRTRVTPEMMATDLVEFNLVFAGPFICSEHCNTKDATQFCLDRSNWHFSV